MGSFKCFVLWLFFFEAYNRIITVSRVCSTDIKQTKVIQNGPDNTKSRLVTIVLIRAMFPILNNYWMRFFF